MATVSEATNLWSIAAGGGHSCSRLVAPGCKDHGRRYQIKANTTTSRVLAETHICTTGRMRVFYRSSWQDDWNEGVEAGVSCINS